MKLRIKGDSLRLRLVEQEVEALLRRGRVAERIHLGPRQGLTYGLETGSGIDRIGVRYGEGELTVLLPEPAAREWATSDQVGLEERLAVGGDRRLRVLVEKDFPCSHA